MKWADAARLVIAGIEETLFYYTFPHDHWRGCGRKWGTRRYMDMNRLAPAGEAA